MRSAASTSWSTMPASSTSPRSRNFRSRNGMRSSPSTFPAHSTPPALAVPGMKKRSWGRIVNIASAHALVASPFKSAYVAAKHGIAGLTKTVALELAEHGITVNAVCPGYVMTPLVEKQIPEQAKARGITEAAGDLATCCSRRSRPSASSPSKSSSALVDFLCTDDARIDHRRHAAGRRRLDRSLKQEESSMRKADVLKLPSMPMAGPSYPAGPYRFVNREFMVITYETDPELIRAQPARAAGADRSAARALRMDQDAGQLRLRQLHRIRHGDPVPVQRRGGQFRLADVSRRRSADRRRPRDLGLSEEIRPPEARSRQGHADRHARICRPARRHGHHGLQA